MKWHFALTYVFLAAFLISCKKDNTLNSNQASGKPSVAFQLKATNPSLALNRIMANSSISRTNGTTIDWTSAQASVSMIKFEAKKSGSEVEFKSQIHRTIDLLSSMIDLGSLSIPSGNFSEVEFKVQLSPDGTTPALELKGQFNSGSTTSKIIFRANEIIEIKGEKANVMVTDSILHKAITSLDLSLITSGISASDLANATITGGDILISSTVNENLYKIIVKNLKELGKEEDFD